MRLNRKWLFLKNNKAMDKKLTKINNYFTKKKDKAYKEIETLNAEEKGATIGYQLYLLRNNYERKVRTMLLYTQYERILVIANERTGDEAIAYLKNLVQTYEYSLLELSPMQRSSCPITNITSLWEQESKQIVLKEIKKLLNELGE